MSSKSSISRIRVFISYSSRDRVFANKLANDLKSNQVNIWLDEWEIKVGDSILEKLESGIKNSNYLIVVLSPNFVNSPWVKEELKAALSSQISGLKIRVLPVLYQDCVIPLFLKDKRLADFRGDKYSEGLKDLLKAINPCSFNEYNDSFDLTNPDFWCEKHHKLISGYHVDRFFDISASGLSRELRLLKYLPDLPEEIANHFINQIVLVNQDRFNIDRILAANHIFDAYYKYLEQIIGKYSTTGEIKWRNKIRLANYHPKKGVAYPSLREKERVLVFDIVLAGGNLKSELIRYVISQKAIPIGVLVFVYDKGVNNEKYRPNSLKLDPKRQQYSYKIFQYKVPVYVIDSQNSVDVGFTSATKCEVCNPTKRPEKPLEICPLHAPF